MKTVLQLNSSIFGENGVSSSLNQALVDGLQSVFADTKVVKRDLVAEALPHFDASTVTDISEGKAELADTLIDELNQADIIVIGAPMYNFAIPSQLKTWFDHITRAGVTFKYTEQGHLGLLNNKTVYVITTSGGDYTDTSLDGVEPWLKTILNFVGLDQDLHFIRVTGLARSKTKEHAKAKAEAEIAQIIQALENS